MPPLVLVSTRRLRKEAPVKREFDIDGFFAALDSKKAEQGTSWRGLSEELELGDHTLFTRMSRGQVPPANTLLTLAGWLGQPLERFSNGEVEAADSARTPWRRSTATCEPTRRS